MALTTPARPIDFTHFAEVEASYGDATATPSGTDAFRSRARTLGFKEKTSRLDRDQDSDRSASVHSAVLGRREASFEYPMALAPSGVTGTPTAPDWGEFARAHFGTQRIGVGHSTCTTGSTTTVIAGSSGAGAALGVAVGDFLAFVTTAGIEARQVTVVATDTFTVSPALTSAPANGSAIYAAVTYKLSKNTLLSMIGYGYLDGDFEHMCPGMAVADMEISYDLNGDAPEPMLKFSGPAQRVEILGTSLPSPTLQTNRGIGPAPAYIWIDGTKTCVTKMALKSNNGMQLINDGSCNLYPSGIVRTGNDGRYLINFEFEVVLVGSTVEDYYDNARTLTAHDLTVQVGSSLTTGICAFRLPKHIPEADQSDVNNKVAIKLGGRAYGNGTDDTEITMALFF